MRGTLVAAAIPVLLALQSCTDTPKSPVLSAFPNEPTAPLAANTVPPSLSVLPSVRALAFGEILEGQSKSVLLSLQQERAQAALDLSVVHYEPDRVEVALERRGTDEFACAVRVRAAGPPGPFFSDVILRSNLSSAHDVHLPISGIVVGDARAMPWQIELGRVRQGERVRRRVLLTPRNNTRITSVETDLPDLVLETDLSAIPAKLYAVYTNQGRVGDISGAVRIHFNTGGVTSLAVSGEALPPTDE